MALVVFLRGVNVGGRKTFQPSALARKLADFDTVNVGAAGTFLVRKAMSQAALRAEVRRRLPFEAEVMICRARDLLDLEFDEPDSAGTPAASVSRYVSVLAKRLAKPPSLPITQPAGSSWQVKVFRIAGKFALSLHRRIGRTLIYPNEVVEKTLGVSATTRSWNTISTIRNLLGSG